MHAGAHELKEVLVARDDGHLQPVRDRALGQRTDDIVRLVLLMREYRDPERFACLVDPRDLLGQVGRHRGAICFVVGRQTGAERRPLDVKRRGDQLGLMVGNQLAQHRDEAIDGVRRLAVRSGQAVNRVIRAIHLRATVDQEDARAGGHEAPGV